MAAGVSRFDCFPSDLLNGMVGLTADEISVYIVVLLLQYDRGGPVQYEGRERELSVRAGMSRGRLGKAVAGLLDLGKLEMASGALLNRRAEREIAKIHEKISKNRENSAKGGEANRQNFERKHNKNNERIEPTGYPNGYPSDSPIPLPPTPYKELKDICPKRVRTKYPDLFEKFWSEYPTDANMSKKEALAVWQRLPDEDRQKAIDSLAGFKAYCRSNPDYRPIHANRYLAKERFNGHLQAAKKIEARQVFVAKGTPEWEAWERYEGRKLVAFESKEARATGNYFSSQWPPSTDDSRRLQH